MGRSENPSRNFQGGGKGSAGEDNFQLPSAVHSALIQNTLTYLVVRFGSTVANKNHSTPHCSSIIQGPDEDAAEQPGIAQHMPFSCTVPSPQSAARSSWKQEEQLLLGLIIMP